MTTRAPGAGVGEEEEEVTASYGGLSPYDKYLAALGLPIHRGYYIEDLRKIPLGRWEARECDAAFLELEGQQGVTGAYVTEIAPGKTIPFHRLALDEVIYVLQGRGMTTVKSSDSSATRSFEWQTHSLFIAPGNFNYQLANMQGNQPARLLHVSYLPLAMGIVKDPSMFMGDKAPASGNVDLARYYSEAHAVVRKSAITGRESNVWSGNFFPDMREWDRLQPQTGRGGSLGMGMEFPGSAFRAHMMVIKPRTYKKAHRHGPGFMIVVPGGDGYSVMWPEGAEKVVCPWHEASIFVPPNRWWHQHFSLGDEKNGVPAGRCLAIHPPAVLRGVSEKVEDVVRDQIEFVDEDPWLRERFESELAKRGMKSDMPDEAYKNKDYNWNYNWDPEKA